MESLLKGKEHNKVSEKYSKFSYNKAPKIKVPPPGPKTKELINWQKEAGSGAVYYPTVLPLALKEAKGATIKDADDNVYIDLVGGVGVATFGHSNPRIVSAAANQMKHLTHALDFPVKERREFVEALISVAPPGMRSNSRVFMGGPTGTDAVEAALKLAQLHTGRSTFIGYQGGYHGYSRGALSVSATDSFKQGLQPFTPKVIPMPYPYCYRCPLDMEYPSCDMACLRYLERALENPYGGTGPPAAILFEPVQGQGGVVVPPPEYLTGLREICNKYEVLLIADEIQCGFCRTGKVFATEHSGVAPDVLVMAKAMGGGEIPLSGILYSKGIKDFTPGMHGGTFRGQIAAMAASSEAIAFMKETALLEHVRRQEKLVRRRLEDLKIRSRTLGDIRSLGLMIGLEFVTDKKTRKPHRTIVADIQKRCLEQGVMIWKAGAWGQVIRLMPPLIITERLLSKALDVLVEAVLEAESC